MLTSEQKQAFHAKGYVPIPGIAGGAAEAFEAFVWARLEELHGIRRHDRATWDHPAPWVGMKKFKDAELLQSFTSAELCSAVDELLGPGELVEASPLGRLSCQSPETGGNRALVYPDRRVAR